MLRKTNPLAHELRSGRCHQSNRIRTVRNRSLRWVAAGLLAVTTPTSVVVAQEFGRWWWEGLASVGRRSHQNRTDGTSTRSDLTDLRLAGAMNGYLFHPAIGDFRVGLDLVTSKSDSVSTLNSHRAGFDTRFNLLPKGAFPLQLFARRQFYDYSGSALDNPFGSFRVPDESREYGGRFRVRKGVFRGLFLGFNNVQTLMEGTTPSDDLYNRQFLDWNRSSKKFQHRFSISRLYRNYFSPNYGLEDISATFDERAQLNPKLLWELYATGIRRDRSLDDQRLLLLDNYRLRTRARQQFHRGDYLEVAARYSRLIPDTAPSTDISTLSTFYRRLLGRGWELGPFGEYTAQRSDGLRLRSPRLGLSARWARQRNKLDAQIAGFASYGSVEFEDRMEVRKESNTSMRLTGTLAHGLPRGLRKELEFEVSRNQLELSRDPVDETNEGFHPFATVGAEDHYRVRGVLLHQWEQRYLSGWLQWQQVDGYDLGLDAPVVGTSTTGALQYGSQKYTLLANVGRNETVNGSLVQKIDYRLLRLIWRPLRYLSVRGAYRDEVRQLAFSPNIDGLRVEAGVTIHAGLFDVEAFASRMTERLTDMDDRGRTQYNIFISRRFGGWLPVTTGTKRRGVIR